MWSMAWTNDHRCRIDVAAAEAGPDQSGDERGVLPGMCDNRGEFLPAACDRVVDDADQGDHREYGPQNWYAVQEAVVEVEQLSPAHDSLVGPRIAHQPWPRRTRAGGGRQGEVDDHGPAIDQPDDVDDQAPAPELERCLGPWPAPRPGPQDRQVGHEVAQVDHRGRRRGDRPGAGELDERDRRQESDDDAGPDRGVQV